MNYNILAVANEDYKEFVKVFVNSLFENYDLINVDNIFIFDTGLSKETIDYLCRFPKVTIKETEVVSKSSEIHDEGWRSSTYSKTRFLLDTIKQYPTPCFMIDSDSIFVGNFDHLIDWEADIVACNRDREGFSKHIGSFFGAINIERSIEFIEKWIANLEFLQKNSNLKHCESPALSKTIQENDFKLQEIPEQIVSAVFPDEDSLIYHLKSDYYAKTIEARLQLPHALPYTRRYL